ncbi:MAG: protein translocase subunit SecD [Candidatus Magasanikbacteria bacterium]|nr:protein translocase subunit SecD [Candidatus Magasanikbacteria bacterium]
MGQKYRQTRIKQFTRREITLRTFGTLVLFVLCALIVLPSYANRVFSSINKSTNIGLPMLPDKGFNLGLDLQGGAHLIYEAKTDQVTSTDKAGSVEGVRDVIERRVRGGLGVAEPLVQTTRVGSAYRIIVELPGVTDVNTAIKMIGETPVLEFKEANTEPPRSLTTEEQKQLKEYNLAADKKAASALADLRRGKEFAEVAATYSEDEKSKNNGGDLGFITQVSHPEFYAWASTHNDNTYSATPIKLADGVSIIKRFFEQPGKKEVSAAHILICYQGATGCDPATTKTKDQAKTDAINIKNQATVQNFADLVKQFSTEPGAAARGGELGFFTKETMVPEFANAVWDVPAGSIVGPVETQFGYHIIYKKAEQVLPEYKVARIFVKYLQTTDLVPLADEWKPTGLSGKQLAKAEVTEDTRTGQIQVSLNFDSDGAKLFADITTRNVNKEVAIFLDGAPISVPRVNEPILSGSAVISGSFNLQDAKLLAQRLNSGALPVPVELISQEKVDATLGQGSLTKSFKAGLVGLLLVMIFMVLYYRLPGLLSVISLLIYAALNLAIFKLIGVTLTLAGIAGFILSIGMAVDANVLQFERLKEELRLGKNLKSAMEEAFWRAWPSIRDSHVTGLISCVLLIWFGSGFIQGFAVILGIGTLVSLFTAISITRTIVRFIFYYFPEKGNRLFLGYTPPPVNSNQPEL